MAEARSLRAKWDAGEPAFGMWAGIDSSLAAELAALAGYDYVCVDLQHGMSDERTMVVDVPGDDGWRRGPDGADRVDRAVDDHARARPRGSAA